MTNHRTDNIINLNNRKEEPIEPARLITDGDTHELKSFIISGETPEGKRLILTWNASLDEILSYNSVLNICVQDSVRDAMDTSRPR